MRTFVNRLLDRTSFSRVIVSQRAIVGALGSRIGTEGGLVPHALPVPILVDLKDNEARVIRTVVKASVWISHHTLPSSLAGFLADGNPVTIIVKAGGAVRIPLEWSTMLGFLFTPISIV